MERGEGKREIPALLLLRQTTWKKSKLSENKEGKRKKNGTRGGQSYNQTLWEGGGGGICRSAEIPTCKGNKGG